jgi:hypothetical protein
MKRPTIADIASRAGVTKAMVSFALNGQPGRVGRDQPGPDRGLAAAGRIGRVVISNCVIKPVDRQAGGTYRDVPRVGTDLAMNATMVRDARCYPGSKQ